MMPAATQKTPEHLVPLHLHIWEIRMPSHRTAVCTTPFALQMRRLKGFFALFSDFKKGRGSAASAAATQNEPQNDLNPIALAHLG